MRGGGVEQPGGGAVRGSLWLFTNFVPVSKTPISTDDRCSGKPDQLPGDLNSLCCLDDTHAGIPQLDKYQARDDFGQSLVVLDPLLQDKGGSKF